ncbi:MAG: extracellular solute-binding protein [Acholeplasmataceae bacterium]|nr:extracellular solute-binding protein [Acholeplasmataceae bacterium]
MKSIITLMSVFMFALILVACLDSSDQNPETRKVIVYMSGPENMINKLESEYEKTAGDVIDITIMGCGPLRDKVWTESQSGEIEADVIYGSDPILFNKLDALNELWPLELEDNVQDMISPDYLVDDRNYALVVERYVVLMSTTDPTRLVTFPTGFHDIASESYAGQTAFADASQSATAFAIAMAIYGLNNQSMDIFEDMANHGIKLVKSNGSVPTGILDGTYDLGIVPSDAMVRLANKAKQDGYELELQSIWPSEGALALQRPIGISVQEDRPEAVTDIAQDFVNWMLGEQSQTIQNQNGFVSVRIDIENNLLPEGIVVIKTDWDTAVNNESTFKDAYNDIFKN